MTAAPPPPQEEQQQQHAAGGGGGGGCRSGDVVAVATTAAAAASAAVPAAEQQQQQHHHHNTVAAAAAAPAPPAEPQQQHAAAAAAIDVRPPLRVWCSWSSGKDSAFMLHTLRQRPDEYDVVGLLTTVNEQSSRVAMHAVRVELLRQQAAAAGLPVHEVLLPYPCSNEQYESKMRAALDAARAARVDAVAFGDLFLRDVRAYREARMAGTGVGALFPLWLGGDVPPPPPAAAGAAVADVCRSSDDDGDTDSKGGGGGGGHGFSSSSGEAESEADKAALAAATAQLARRMQAAGVRAVLTCVDPKRLPASFAGREWDASLLEELQAWHPDVDLCGERGEFHSFVYDCPAFSASTAGGGGGGGGGSGAIAIVVGETIERDGFVFADVLPAGEDVAKAREAARAAHKRGVLDVAAAGEQ